MEPTVTSFNLLELLASAISTLSLLRSTVTVERFGAVMLSELSVNVSVPASPNVLFPFAARSPERVVVPVTPSVVPIVAAPVTPRLPSVAAPVTPRVVPTVAAPVTLALASVEAPVTERLPSVESPVTPSVVPTVAAPVTPTLANVEAPVTLRVLPIPTAPVSVEMPVTDRVPGIVRPPVIPSVPPIVALPLVVRELREVAPVTARVPKTPVLPLVEATVNLFVATLKSPLMLEATVETWSAESLPEPSLSDFRDAVSVALSVVFSRPV